jgi:hypothetical protein
LECFDTFFGTALTEDGLKICSVVVLVVVQLLRYFSLENMARHHMACHAMCTVRSLRQGITALLTPEVDVR